MAGRGLTKQLVAVVPLVVAAPFVWFRGRRRLAEPDQDADSSARLAFYLGSLIFLGTFAVGNNFDYRLVFMLLTLPQLFDWVTDKRATPAGGWPRSRSPSS